jgi:hypothetical protein
MDIGRDDGLVVDLPYEKKAPYTGMVRNVVFHLACPERRRHTHERRRADSEPAPRSGKRD